MYTAPEAAAATPHTPLMSAPLPFPFTYPVAPTRDPAMSVEAPLGAMRRTRWPKKFSLTASAPEGKAATPVGRARAADQGEAPNPPPAPPPAPRVPPTVATRPLCGE